MIRSIRPNRSKIFRDRPLESLEMRGLLSNVPSIASSLPVPSLVGPTVAYGESLPSASQITTLPADSSQSDAGPSQLIITFARPISSFDLGGQDIRLDRVNSDGSTTPLFDFSNWPQQIANNNDGFDLTFTELTIPLDFTLTDGTYQIVLVGGSIISSDIAEGQWDPFSDYVISTFTVGATQTGGRTEEGGGGEEEGGGETVSQDPAVETYSNLNPGSDVQSFHDLGELPAAATIQPAVQNQVQGRTSVSLYRFMIADGHHWRIGISANPLGSGSGFQTSLALFRINADGSLAEVSLGDPGAGISDPQRSGVTFLGIDSGTYLLAVSGIFHESAATLPEGMFQLSLDAVPADQPVEVIDFDLNWTESKDESPAGLTIRFSGPIALDGFSEANEATPPLEVVDSQGQVWAILPFNYVGDENSLTLVFGQRLPAGTYSLRIGSVKGLTDLAGWTPVAAGLPAGILATWTVEAETVTRPQSDLGIVWPKSAGIGRSGQVSDGATTRYNFDVITPGLYKVQAIVARGVVEGRIVSSDGHIYLDWFTDSPVTSFQVKLPVGSYSLEWIGQSSTEAELSWTLNPSKIDWESLLNNGVGQWATVHFGFGSGHDGDTSEGKVQNPTTHSGPGSGPGSGSGMGSGPNTVVETTSTSPVVSRSEFTPRTVSLSRPLLLSPIAIAPVGMPSAQMLTVSAVGPAVEPGAIAVADNTPGLTPGIRYKGLSGRGFLGQEASTTSDLPTEQTANGPADQTAVSEDSGKSGETSSMEEHHSEEADQDVLASADWILGIGRMIEHWITPSSHAEHQEPESQPDPGKPLMIAGVELSGAAREQEGMKGRDERAAFDFPFCVVVASALAYRAKAPLRRWWRKDRLAQNKVEPMRHENYEDEAIPQWKREGRFGHGPHFNKRPGRVAAQRPSHRETGARGSH